MQMLKDTLRQKASILPGNIVKVDSFLNHRIDVALIEAIAEDVADHYDSSGATLILTIEASGIAIAYSVARRMNLPLVFAKKGQAQNIGNDVYVSEIFSFTRNQSYSAFVSKSYLNENDKVLLIDDFLANGQALLGLISICDQAKANVVGAGIAIEKQWQNGAKAIEAKGIEVYSAAVIESLDSNKLHFAGE